MTAVQLALRVDAPEVDPVAAERDAIKAVIRATARANDRTVQRGQVDPGVPVGGPPVNHGTRARYLRGCLCEPCQDAHRRYVKAYKHQTRPDSRTGVPSIPKRVPVDVVLAHIAALLESGWTVSTIVAESGVPETTFRFLRHGRYRSVSPRNAARLLELEPLPDDDGIDVVVVDRLVAAYPNRVWDSIGATRAERVAAAEVLDARGHQVRRHLRDAGYGDQQIETPSRTGIEDALSLRMGRDFAIRSAS